MTPSLEEESNYLIENISHSGQNAETTPYIEEENNILSQTIFQKLLRTGNRM